MYVLIKNRIGDLIVWKDIEDAPGLMEYVTHLHNGTGKPYKGTLDTLEYPQNATLYSNIAKRIIISAESVEELVQAAVFEVLE